MALFNTFSKCEGAMIKETVWNQKQLKGDELHEPSDSLPAAA
jgi:hypothetical protein